MLTSNSLSLGYEALRHGDFPSHVDDPMVFIQNEKGRRNNKTMRMTALSLLIYVVHQEGLVLELERR